MRTLLLTICLAATIGSANSQVNNNNDKKIILNGKWLTTAYIKELAATLSPHKAQQKVSQTYQLFIDLKTSDKKSTVTDMWTLHEGGFGFSIFFKPGVKKDTWKTNYKDYDHAGTAFSDIGYETIEKDTQLVMYHYGKNNKLLYKTYFSKAGIGVTDNTQVLDQLVNKIIFSGTYRLTDGAGNANTVQFSNEGTVTGLDGFEKYNVNTFFLEAKNFYDEIYFTSRGKTIASYAFKKEGKTLYLYELTKEDKYYYKQGALKYTLTQE